VDLGKDINDFCKGSIQDRNNFSPILRTYHGMGLAIVIGEQWLETKETEEKTQNLRVDDYAREVREKGVTSLRKLGDVLQTAESDSFNEYAQRLSRLFEGWSAWAEESIALSCGTCEPPMTRAGEKIFWGIGV